MNDHPSVHTRLDNRGEGLGGGRVAFVTRVHRCCAAARGSLLHQTQTWTRAG
jgi:hypothetical protein